jgi:DNA-binding XRE family transcriptional regulator
MTKEEFKKIRLESGYSQNCIADLLGVSSRTIQRYESGASKLPFGIAELFKIKMGKK